MAYVPSFYSINEKLVFTRENGEPWVKIQYEAFENIVRQFLLAIPVDETWYRATYPDVDQAIRDGKIASSHEHFVASGYFEGRPPSEIEVDEEFYFKTYPDIGEAHAKGEIASAREHFEQFGRAEGRLPHA